MSRTERTIAFEKGSLHVEDFGGEGPTTVLVHGLGGSHANWSAAGPLLAKGRRVVALDLPGFGLSEPLETANMDYLGRAVDRVVSACESGEIPGTSGPVVLVGNSMGGALAILHAARRPRSVSALALVCPAVPQPDLFALDPRFTMMLGASMLPGYDAFLRSRLAEAGPEAMVHEMLKLCCVDVGRVPREVVREMEALSRRRATQAWIGRSFSEAARSLVLALTRRDRFYEAMRAVTAPVLVLHGERDRLVPVGAARNAVRVCPSWELEILYDVGHVPQLETPDRLVTSIEGWLARVGARAA